MHVKLVNWYNASIKANNIVHIHTNKGIHIYDYGVEAADPSVLYPDVALTVAQAVATGKHDRGILMCGTWDRSGHHDAYPAAFT